MWCAPWEIKGGVMQLISSTDSRYCSLKKKHTTRKIYWGRECCVDGCHSQCMGRQRKKQIYVSCLGNIGRKAAYELNELNKKIKMLSPYSPKLVIWKNWNCVFSSWFWIMMTFWRVFYAWSIQKWPSRPSFKWYYGIMQPAQSYRVGRARALLATRAMCDRGWFLPQEALYEPELRTPGFVVRNKAPIHICHRSYSSQANCNLVAVTWAFLPIQSLHCWERN